MRADDYEDNDYVEVMNANRLSKEEPKTMMKKEEERKEEMIKMTRWT